LGALPASSDGNQMFFASKSGVALSTRELEVVYHGHGSDCGLWVSSIASAKVPR
jgi:hypothetical protein